MLNKQSAHVAPSCKSSSKFLRLPKPMFIRVYSRVFPCHILRPKIGAINGGKFKLLLQVYNSSAVIGWSVSQTPSINQKIKNHKITAVYIYKSYVNCLSTTRRILNWFYIANVYNIRNRKWIYQIPGNSCALNTGFWRKSMLIVWNEIKL